MKKSVLLIVLLILIACVVPVSAQKLEGLEIMQLGPDMWKYGNLNVNIPADEFLETFELGDIVTVAIDGYGSVDVPVCSNYDDVFLGEKLLRSSSGKDYLTLAVAYGQLGVDLGIVENAPEDFDYSFQVKDGIEFPISVSIEMKEKGAYKNRLALGLLTRSDKREDYPELTDAEFANFREITTEGMGAGKLYRSSSPVKPDFGRNGYADAAAEAAGIRTFINLSDSQTVAEAYDNYDKSYYSTQNIIFLNMPDTILSEAFTSGLAEGFRYMIGNEAPYLLHCSHGKDRSGFAAAVLEALMGAGLEEITEDYSKTYVNFFDVKDGKQQTIRPEVLDTIDDIIVRSMSTAFGIEDLSTVDLAEAAENYLLSIGLTAEEIASLKAVLS